MKNRIHKLFTRRAKWELSVLCALLLCMTLGSFTQFAAVCDEVRGDTLRLHIRAESDSSADQQMKLLVRDEIIRCHGQALAQAKNRDDAVRIARALLPQILATARRAVRQNGGSCAVSGSVSEVYFPTTRYTGFTMPAGVYSAVCIRLGSGQGHNWFCVMFPPLCLPAAQPQGAPAAADESAPEAAADEDEAAAFAAFSEDEQAVLQCPYRVRFAFVEWLQSLRAPSAVPRYPAA